MAKTVQEQIAALKARIEADTTKLKELEASESAKQALATLKQGDIISFVYGRAENRAEHKGEVRSVFDTDKGQRVKVLYGEGADEQIVTIEPGAITAVAQEVDEADAPAGNVAAADPLASIE